MQHTRMIIWKRWQLYLLAVTSTLLTLLIRQGIAVSFGERPLLILFMFPIILSASIGGLGPGLVATLVAAVSVSYFALPLTGNFEIEYSYDLLQLGFLVANGLLVSFLSSRLHYARHRSENAQKRAELNLANKSRVLQLLDGIAEGSTDAIFAKDLQGRYLLFNQAAASFVGKSAQEVLGKDDTTFFPPEQAALIQKNDRQVMQDDQVVSFHENLNTENGKAYFLATKGPLHDEAGKVIGLFGISRNITERQQAEEALLRQTEELQSRNEELERFNKATVGRELDMITLKKQINELSSRLGQEPPYPLNFLDEHAKTPKGGETP